MKSKFLIRFLLVIVLIGILYKIWALPFNLLAKRAILPTVEKTGILFAEAKKPFVVLGNIKNLVSQNKRLNDENQQLSAQIASLKDSAHFCTQTQAEISATSAIAQNLVVGKIIGRTPNDFNQTIIVDKGGRDGIKTGAAVVSNGYLIGQVRKVDPSASEVYLITNHNSLIPAVLESSRELGLVQGGLEGLTMIDIPSATKILPNEKVLTSNTGGIVSGGILIGEVVQDRVSKGLFQSVKISSPVVISKIEVVSIVK